MTICEICRINSAKIKTAKDKVLRCFECFQQWFEQDVHRTITSTKMFKPGDRIAVGVSGGKDSTVLATVLSRLNQRHAYGLELILICVDEGIKGYRDDSIKEVRKNEVDLALPLTIVSYKELYGWTMDEIVAKIGKKNNCTFCGVFRRQALDRAALKEGACKLATGHNADDLAETVVMNILRGDVARLQRTSAHVSPGDDESLPRIKPLKYSYEKDIVMYAHFGRFNYFSTECVYAPNSYRNNARPQAILDIIYSGETMVVSGKVQGPVLSRCQKCGYIASQKYCKACLLLYGLNDGEEMEQTNSVTTNGVSALKCGSRSDGGCGCSTENGGNKIDF